MCIVQAAFNEAQAFLIARAPLFMSSFTNLLPWVTEALLVQFPVLVESLFMNCVKSTVAHRDGTLPQITKHLHG